ncbi:MAG: SRPBCC family protein [Tannerellaceae bacterium]|jgi:hypothetical protein|nr:SRPBCC family protein [Tannerellaceae bacterium]
MTEFVSDIQTIPFGDDRVFKTLSDFNSLERVKDAIPVDKLEGFRFDSDTCSFSVIPLGQIQFRIVEREPNKTVKFATTESPVPLNICIQLEQVAEDDTQIKLTLHADLNPFLKQAVSGHLQTALDRVAVLLASFPY